MLVDDLNDEKRKTRNSVMGKWGKKKMMGSNGGGILLKVSFGTKMARGKKKGETFQ